MKRNGIDKLGYIGYRSCARKKRYKLENEAKSKAHDYKMDYYYCEICKGYHLTKKR